MRATPTEEHRPPRIAFAVGRSVGNAVARNRVRRRLRAAIDTHAARLVAGGLYLVEAAPGAADLTYSELEETMGIILQKARRELEGELEGGA